MSRSGKRIVFWAVALLVIGLMAGFVFSNRAGSRKILDAASPKLEEKGVDGIVNAKFSGFSWDQGLEFKYAIMKGQSVLLRGVYHPFTGEASVAEPVGR